MFEKQMTAVMENEKICILGPLTVLHVVSKLDQAMYWQRGKI